MVLRFFVGVQVEGLNGSSDSVSFLSPLFFPSTLPLSLYFYVPRRRE